MLQVALDVTPAVSGVTGVSRYAVRLAAELPRHDVQVHAFAVGRGPGAPPPGTRHIRVPLRIMQPAWRLGLAPTAERLAGGGQLVHSLDLQPPRTRLPLVMTVHDIAALQRPDLHPETGTKLAALQLEAARRADVVIAVSGATADLLVEQGIDRERIRVVHIAPAPLPPPSQHGAAGGAAPFVLAVGQLTARKNFGSIVEALDLPETRRLHLVVAGPDGFRGDEVRADVAARGMQNRVRFAGRVGDQELSDLYAAAAVVCLPSVIEGFGLPVVEAFARGVPVVATDIPIMHEIAGDAAKLVPVGDVAALADALLAVISDQELRAELSKLGLERSTRFSWDKTAAETVDAYRHALR